MEDRLRLLQNVLNLAQFSQNFQNDLAILLGGPIINFTGVLTLQNVIDIVNRLDGIDCFVVNVDGELSLADFVTQNSVDTTQNFFDFVRTIINNDDVVRFDEQLTDNNFFAGKRTSFAYVPVQH